MLNSSNKFNKQINLQINSFIENQRNKCVERTNNSSSRNRVIDNFLWLKYFAYDYFESRIARALDLDTIQIKEVQQMSKNFNDVNTQEIFATCVDGRTIPAIMFSKPPHVERVLRTPAGTVNGFMLGVSKNNVFINKNSFIVQEITSYLINKPKYRIFYNLDSHIGCAARNQIHETEGNNQIDSGLRSDVMNKIMTARGLLQLREHYKILNQKVAEIIPTFFSYDPRNGGVILGLEMHISRKEISQEGYTDNNINELAGNGLILKSLDLLNDDRILNELKKVLIPSTADFKRNYPDTLLTNWKAITKLYEDGNGKTYKIIYKKLKSIYTKSKWRVSDKYSINEKTISKEVLEHGSKFILRNLVTRFSIAGNKDYWPFSEHSEELIVITDGGYAPFSSLDAFAVFSKDLNSLVANTKLTIDLLRTFRRNGKIFNHIKDITLSLNEFVAVPILISNKAILKTSDKESFDVLSKLNLNKTFTNIDWDNPQVLAWKKSDIANLILDLVSTNYDKLKISVSLRFVDAVYELFNRMRLFMKDKQFRQMIIKGNIVIFNTIVDDNRMPRVIIDMAV